MGFFGEVIDEEGMEIPIPEGYQLKLLTACANPDRFKSKSSRPPLVVYAQSGENEQELILGIVDPSNKQYQCLLGHEFGEEDGPVVLKVTGGELHVTGQWSWGSECDGDHGDEEEDDDEDDEEAPELVPLDEEEEEEEELVVEEPPKAKKSQSKKTKLTAAEDQSKSLDEESQPPSKKQKKVGLKPWKPTVEGDEGVVVPEPKVVERTKGLKVTDYIVGKGAEPRPGATVKILYEGMFSDGTVFDAKLKRKQPFVFRKGTGMVIKGMDAGLEGMRVGGARELFIPSSLGYGPKGLDIIPGNQDLVFRIRLIA
eukprot:gene11197-12485_t